MLGMWKPTPNGDILLQQITNSHGEDGMHPSDEACLRIANVGQAMKEGLVCNTIQTPPIIGPGHLPQVDAPSDFRVSAQAAHEAACHPKCMEVLYW